MITMHDRPRQRHRQTDKRTDRRTNVMAIARFFLTNASRAKSAWYYPVHGQTDKQTLR